MYTTIKRYDTIVLGLYTEERRNKKKNAKSLFFYFAWCVCKIALYRDIIYSFDWKSAINYDGGF